MIEIIKFKCLSIEDRDTINRYMAKSQIESYEYLFSSLYLWRKLNDVKYAIIDGALVIDKNEEGKGSFYAQPIEYEKENLHSLVEMLLEERKNGKDGKEREYLFGDVDENFIDDLKKYTDYIIEIKEDVDDFEYVYNTEDLINLKGKKYHGQKNHCNTFDKLYEYEIKSIDSEDAINDCMVLLQRWHEEVAVTVDKEMCMEIAAIRDIFEHLDYLSLKSIAIYIDNKLAAFAIGERVNEQLAVIHVERGELNYKGVYAFLNRQFLTERFEDSEFVNRQEDCGNPGLRRAKESYHPAKMVKKYLLKINKA